MALLRPKYGVLFDLLETPSDIEASRSKKAVPTSAYSTDYPSDSTSSCEPQQLHQGAGSSSGISSVVQPTTSSTGNIDPLLAKTPVNSESTWFRNVNGYGRTNTPYTSSSTVSLSNTHGASTLVAVVEGRGHARGEVGMTSIDLKQPVLTLSQFSDSQTYTRTLAIMQLLNPLEILLPSTLCERGNSSKLFGQLTKHFPNVQISSVQRRYFNESCGLQYIKHLCAAEYKSIELQLSSKYYCLATTAALLKYVEFIQNVVFAPHSLKAVFKGCEHSTMIDSSTVRNLELLQNMRDATSKQTLFDILNFTKTIGGCRLLKSNILQPLNDEETIRLRLDAVAELIEKGDVFSNLQLVVSKCVDIGHIIGVCVQIPKQDTVRVAENKLTCVLLLKHMLQLVEPLMENLSYCENKLLKIYCKALEDQRFKTVLGKINEVIEEGAQYHKGHLQHHIQKCMSIKSQRNGFLDVARRTYSELVEDTENYIRQLAESHKLPLRTAYSSLRGFHIQMSAFGDKGYRNNGTVQEKLPPVFVKVSKWKNTFSFTTLDLLQLNERMKTALNEIYNMANIVVTELLAQIHEHMGCLYLLCDIVSMTDMLLAFASAASLSSYVCPEFTDTLAIKQGLHPILQKIYTDTVVPNDTYATENCNCVIITGPNMGGKSTYLRQIALLQIMAQIGSFVPAQYASFRIANQIFSRIGCDDDIESNSSTFTLEMMETSYILQNIADNSLVIIDELGKGTSVEEGVGISWATAEYLAKTKAYTFFATHFKQLTLLNSYNPNIVNCHFETHRTFSNDNNCHQVSYPHVLLRGVAQEKHYGLLLVELLPVPSTVIADAKEIVARIETQRNNLVIGDAVPKKQHAVFSLGTRLIQVAKNSKMDGSSLKVYLKSLHKIYHEEMKGTKNLT